MRTKSLPLITAALLLAAIAAPHGAAAQMSRKSAPDAMQWVAAPAVLPAGAQIAILDGDPARAEPFTLRLRFPDGYRIPPHTHPTDEHVTVIKGTFAVGMGTSFDARGMQKLGAGGYVTAPANQPHYAEAHGVTIVQVHAMGPFQLTYVNPADAPATSGTH